MILKCFKLIFRNALILSAFLKIKKRSQKRPFRDFRIILLLLGQQRQMVLLDIYSTISQKQPF